MRRHVIRFFVIAATITAALTTPVDGLGADQPTERVQILPTTLTRFGFNPASVKVSKGKVLIAVKDLSNLREASMNLEREERGGQPKLRVSSKSLSSGKRRWDNVLNLSEGTYVLRVDGQPKWQFRIVVSK